MAVTVKDVEHIAMLAKLEFTDVEKEKFTHQMNQILEYMDQLNTLDTSMIEPLSHVIELSNVFRPDEIKPGVSTEDALKNAPARNEQFFKVPKVIGEKP
ncbi:MAG: Asp-tRNA(Asn)/Glu-tRNA(Gln) amidotransferase subunit GatC [Ignavibacteriae bacterium]|nr:MAG: Asp-tRNA(Asn)/Glu-tRNA(Gln) amidotransferase subunit GatC [Ignavibacteriota bacterium]